MFIKKLWYLLLILIIKQVILYRYIYENQLYRELLLIYTIFDNYNKWIINLIVKNLNKFNSYIFELDIIISF